MKDEIKEIIHNLKECCDIHKDENWVMYQKDRIYQLLDYITKYHNVYIQIKQLLTEDELIPRLDGKMCVKDARKILDLLNTLEDVNNGVEK